MAVAELVRAQRAERLRIGGDLGKAERLDLLRAGLFVRRSRERRGCEPKRRDGKSREGEVAPVNHRFLLFVLAPSVAATRDFVEGRIVVTPLRTSARID